LSHIFKKKEVAFPFFFKFLTPFEVMLPFCMLPLFWIFVFDISAGSAVEVQIEASFLCAPGCL